MNDFGSFLKERRAAKALTQEDLSNFLGAKGVFLHNSVISRWERGRRLPGQDQRGTLLTIGDLLGMSYDEKNEFLVRAGLAPLDTRDLDVDGVLQSLPNRWQKTRYLQKEMQWDEKRIGEKLGIPFWEVGKDITRAELLEKHEAPESSLVIWLRDWGAPAVDTDKAKGGRLVRFTLGNCSENVITAERMCLEVLRCEPNNRRPPIGAKVTPWKYEVELNPFNTSPHEYPITQERFRYGGQDADDFELVCVSPGGHKYTARLNVPYTDLATRKAFTAHSETFELYFDSKESLDRMFRKGL